MIRAMNLGSAAASLFLLASALHAAARTWTNSEGKSIEAEYISSAGETVTLSMNGKEIQYPLENLSEADRLWIKEKQSKPADVKTGILRDVPISASLFPETKDHFKESNRKNSLKEFEGGAYNHKGDSADWIARDFERDLCTIYVPESYDGTEPYGLVVYINPGDDVKLKADWLPIFAERKLIAVAAYGTGNNQPMPRRVLLSMDALATVEKAYRINPERRYVTGLSGGGHMAMLTCALYPEYFQGAISNAAQSYLPSDGTMGTHFPGVPLADFKKGPMKKLNWVVISGDKDNNYNEIKRTSEVWKKERLSYRFIDVPGMGHTNADPRPSPKPSTGSTRTDQASTRPFTK